MVVSSNINKITDPVDISVCASLWKVLVLKITEMTIDFK
jgi:hypothetical protein